MKCFSARGGVLKSIGDMGAVMTNMVLGTAGMTKQVAATMQKKASITGAEDTLVMDTKLKIIEILQASHKIFLFMFINKSILVICINHISLKLYICTCTI